VRADDASPARICAYMPLAKGLVRPAAPLSTLSSLPEAAAPFEVMLRTAGMLTIDLLCESEMMLMSRYALPDRR
jgi:hypothetical protein